MNRSHYDVIVIGGGFYGCRMALEARKNRGSLLLVESASGLLHRASYNNQARVHNGYHYPRSILTALRSRLSFPQFVKEYEECVDSTFDAYYAIARKFSNVSADQFRLFCDRIGAPLAPAPKEVTALFDDALVEAVFQVTEYSFDAAKLRQQLTRELHEEGVEVRLNATVRWLRAAAPSGIEVHVHEGGATAAATAGLVYNCTYSSMNTILQASGLPVIPLKHELVEMPLVVLPAPLKRVGITIMCGPFFSVWPFPSRAMHTLHHVRYTPHCSWQDGQGRLLSVGDPSGMARESRYQHMIHDAARYVPLLRECRYEGSLWEIKTLLPQSEIDDSRPILWRKDHGLANLTCVLGGKIDNVYDALHQERLLHGEQAPGASTDCGGADR